MFAALRNSLRSTARDLPPAFWVLWVGTLVNRLGLFVAPFLTLYLTREQGATIEEATLTVALYGFGSFFSAILGGILADRIGRKPTFVASMLLTAAALLMLGAAESIGLITLLALVLGLVSDLYRPAIGAIVTDLVPTSDRIRAFTLIYWAINLGSAIAPIIAGVALTVGYGVLFVGDALTTLAFGLLVWWRVPETRPDEAAVRSRVVNPFRQFSVALRDVRLVVITLLWLAVGIIMFQAYTTLPLAMQQEGLIEADYGASIALNGLVIVVISIPVAAWATRRPRYLIMAGATMLWAAGFGVYVFAEGSLLIYMFGVVTWTLGELTTTPVGNALVSDIAPIELRGTYMGVVGTSWGMSAALAPIIGGKILADWGSDALWTFCFVVGMLAAAGWWFAGRAFHPRPAVSEALLGDEPRPT